MTDLTDFDTLDVLEAAGETEFVRVQSRTHEDDKYVLHRLTGDSSRAAGVRALRQTRRIVEKYRLRCMLRIVGLFNSTTNAGVLYDDVTFRRIEYRPQVDICRLLGLAIQMVEAVREVHAAGLILHCLQPSSFVFTDSGAKILDFGQATALPVEFRNISSPWQFNGDLRYVAPEQTGRLNRSIDYRTDYYSLGIILYEMFTGMTPFHSGDPVELVHEHLTKTPTPAHKCDTAVSNFLSAVIQKLLSKDPNRRYQSAEGLLADLEIERKNQDDGKQSARVPGNLDIAYNLTISAKIYGRTKERATLISAYERACSGARELVSLTGYAGIGKTALIREVYIPITRQGSYFISGKFEQLERRIPYSAWLAAFDGLLIQILSESEKRLEETRKLLDEGLGANASVLTEVLPNLQVLIGQRPPPITLSPRETQERFAQTICRFTRAFCDLGRPLTIFLDDWQWADAASLNLLEQVANEPTYRHVFIIVATRNNELSPEHPFVQSLERIRDQKISNVVAVELSPLSRGDLTQLVADTFRVPPTEAAPLAAVLAAKSGGNPFFAWQFLRLARAQQLVRFSTDRMRWTWDLAEISAVGDSENVVELMLQRLHLLPEATRTALSWAACLGTNFTLTRLQQLLDAMAKEHPESAEMLDDAQAIIDPALSEELLIAMSPANLVDSTQIMLTLRFSHDRVQEAAYKLLAPKNVISIRHHIARILLDGAHDDEINENIFEIADNLHAARTLLLTREEKVENAEIHLRAVRRAAKSAAFEAALHYVTAAMDNLPDGLSATHPDLTRSLYCARGEYEYLQGNFPAAEHYVRQAIAFETDVLMKAELHQLLVSHLTLRAAYPEAIAAGRDGLALLSVFLPEDDLIAARDEALAHVDQLLGNRTFASLDTLPPMTDRTQLVVMKLLIAMGAPAYGSQPQLWSILVAKEMGLILEYGITSGATYTLPAFGGLRQYLGHGSARECEALHSATSSILHARRPESGASIGHLMGSSLCHWFAPITRASEDFRNAFTLGIETGSLQYAGYALAHDGYCKFYQGLPLRTLINEIENAHDFCAKRKNVWGMDITEGVLRIARALTGDPNEIDSTLGGDYLQRCRDHGNVQVLGIYHTLAAEAYLHSGRFDTAAREIQRASEYLDCFAVQGLLPSIQYHFVHGLLLLWAPDCFELSPEEGLSRAKGILARIERWAAGCPANFEHMASLMKAEIGAVQDADLATIIDDFDRARESASAAKNYSRIGLISARILQFWSKRGKPHYGETHIAKVQFAYRTWQGLPATPEKRATTSNSHSYESYESTATSGTSTKRPSKVPSPDVQLQDLDLHSIMRTAQAVAKSTELGEVVQSVIENVSRVSSAQRTLLLLPQHQRSMQVWEMVGNSESSAHDSPLDTFEALPHSIVQYVMRTMKTFRLDEYNTHFLTQDPYLRAHLPASLICIPILMAQELHGILYLEHREIAGAFDETRLYLLEFLASTTAATVRNANLVQQLRTDIALRMEAEAKLREREREYRLLIEQSPLGIQVFSANGQLIQVNAAYQALWGAHMQNNSNLHDHPLLQRHPDALRHLQDGDAIDLGDHCIVKATDESTHERFVNGRLYAIKDTSGALERIVLKVQDVTERKRIEELKSQFVSTVSHELRTPITSIRGSLGLITGGIAGVISPEVEELVNIALANSERLIRIVDDILDLEKIERGTFVLRLEEINVYEALLTAIESNRGFALQHEVFLGLEAPESTKGLRIHADSDRIAQIATNLISNAVKFSPPRATVVIRLVMTNPTTVRLEVHDTGPGVPLNFRSKLFQRFSQANASDTRRYSGTGLGLNITRELVGRMGGLVGYEPLEPTGSCFYAEFPISSAPQGGVGISSSG